MTVFRAFLQKKINVIFRFGKILFMHLFFLKLALSIDGS